MGFVLCFHSLFYFSFYNGDIGDCYEKIQNVLNNICKTQYDDIDKPIILDKARGWAAAGPCSYDYYDIYSGSNGYYYGTNNGGTSYTLLYSLAEQWFEFQFYDSFFDANVYEQFTVNSASTVITSDGYILSGC